MDRWRASDRWTAVYGAQVVSAGRDVRTTDATTGALQQPAPIATPRSIRVPG